MTAIDTSTEAVERLLENVTPGPWRIKNCDALGDRCTNYFQEIWNDETDILVTTEVTRAHNDGGAANMRFIRAARDLVPALLKERDEAVDAKLDALSTLDAWFDRRELGNEAVNQAVIDAASGYLRTSRVGGMPQVESDLILGVMQDMSRLGLFADIFARAMNDLVPTLLKERDEARARAAAAFEMAATVCSGVIKDYDVMKSDGVTYENIKVQKAAKGLVSIAREDIRALATEAERDALAKVRAKAIRDAVAWFKPIEDAAGDEGLQERREGFLEAVYAIRGYADKIEKGETE